MAVYATSDWHGCGDPGFKILKFLQPDDTLYFLGDAIDRGPDGIDLLALMLVDPKIKMIMGNHEDFMRQSIPILIHGRESYTTHLWTCKQNGGAKTYEALKQLPPQGWMYYADKINQMPYTLTYTSPLGHTVIMEHAGYTPSSIPYRSHDPLWDRDHFYDDWIEDPEYENTYLVHGHTPVLAMKYSYGYYDLNPEMTLADMARMEKEYAAGTLTYVTPEVIRYCKGHKFNIDMGTPHTGRIALLNLDTFETIYFDKEKE